MSSVDSLIRIGTSGWSYDHWRGAFYPDEVPREGMLSYYLNYFDSVEINNSFYHLPSAEIIKKWCDSAPDGFLFSVKASRYITHMKKLKDPKETTARLMDRVTLFGNKLGPILFQLPPHWGFNENRLEAFLNSLNPKYRYAFEFRDRSWLNNRSLELLSTYNAAFCIYDLDGFLSPKEVTTDFIYVRLHGPDGAYQGSYDNPTLNTWANLIHEWAIKGLAVYCYFDNDQAGYAARNALRLKDKLKL